MRILQGAGALYGFSRSIEEVMRGRYVRPAKLGAFLISKVGRTWHVRLLLLA